jgi:hypothetical protein
MPAQLALKKEQKEGELKQEEMIIAQAGPPHQAVSRREGRGRGRAHGRGREMHWGSPVQCGVRGAAAGGRVV